MDAIHLRSRIKLLPRRQPQAGTLNQSLAEHLSPAWRTFRVEGVGRGGSVDCPRKEVRSTCSAVRVGSPFRQSEAPGRPWTCACGRVWSRKKIYFRMISTSVNKQLLYRGHTVVSLDIVTMIWTTVRLYAPITDKGSGNQSEQADINLGTIFLQPSRSGSRR